MLIVDNMSRVSTGFRTLLAALVLVCLHPAGALACAACYGQSDSAMARGFNWGIVSLLGVVVMVLGGITTFFVFLGKKSATLAATAPTESATTHHPPRTTHPSPTRDSH